MNSAGAAAPPNSGTAIEGAKPPSVQQPAQPGAQAPITVEGEPQAEQDTGGQKVTVKSFKISGETPVPEQELLKLVQDEAGKAFTLGELKQLAVRITKHLRQQGYIVAYAYIPAQDVVGGTVEIAVVPGKYGQIEITGDTRLGTDRLKGMLFCAKPGMVITGGPLERALLLINDLSGVAVKATLKRGATPGTADLVLAVADTAKTTGALYADNWGNSATGRGRYGVQIAFNNLGGIGDSFNLGGMTTGEGLDNYNFDYSVPIGFGGATASVRYSQVDYSLGDSFADMGATGRAVVASYVISYPLVRSRTFNLYANFGYDVKHLRDDISSFASYNPKTSNLWNIGLEGNYVDQWLGGGTSAFSLTQYYGRLAFCNSDSAATDATYANTAGKFMKTLMTYQRRQYVAKDLTFSFSFIGQVADKNLDSSEKLFLGGADGVRAFPQGEASGDSGYKLTGEFRWRLARLSTDKNNLFLTTFYDYGNVMVNHQPWPGAGANRRSLMGAGLGLLWTRDRDSVFRMDYAWKIGNEQSVSDPGSNGRLWVQAVKYY